MRHLITGGTIVNEGQVFPGAVIIEDGRIADILHHTDTARGNFDQTTDAAGCLVLPGVIDDHVHFREPGLTDKADIASESRLCCLRRCDDLFRYAEHRAADDQPGGA